MEDGERTAKESQLGDGTAPTGDLHEGLAQALAHVEAAQAHARAGEWEAAGERDRQCRAQVEALVGNAGNLDPEPLADGLSAIRERYRELLTLAETERDRLADDVRQSVKGRVGTRAYEENR
ncbi:flagellar protein FliT [Thioalkalivibrio sulfidiphilus]|uniref:flagellar protein FliT n=1 Tax=Thioalkalivibrio sulfidiphilus TaxID=1033854 RepID=UPI003B37CF0F